MVLARFTALWSCLHCCQRKTYPALFCPLSALRLSVQRKKPWFTTSSRPLSHRRLSPHSALSTLSQPSMPSREHTPETTKPTDVPAWTRVSLEAVFSLRACPSLCVASSVLLLGLLTGTPWGRPHCSWTEWAFLLPLVGPAVVEAWGLQVLRREVRVVWYKY